MQSWASVCWATVEGRGERTDSSVSWASKMKQYFRNSSRSLRGTSGYVFECPSGVINESVGTVHMYPCMCMYMYVVRRSMYVENQSERLKVTWPLKSS